MKYFGNLKERIIPERNLKYIRCDKCNKRLKSNEIFYDIALYEPFMPGGRNNVMMKYQICGDCIKEYINDYLKLDGKTKRTDIEINKMTYDIIKDEKYYDDECSYNDEKLAEEDTE